MLEQKVRLWSLACMCLVGWRESRGQIGARRASSRDATATYAQTRFGTKPFTFSTTPINPKHNIRDGIRIEGASGMDRLRSMESVLRLGSY